MAAAGDTPILATAVNEGLDLDPAKLRIACQKSGRSSMGLGIEIMRAARSKARMLPLEYLGYGLWRKELTPEARAAYISLSGVTGVNERLTSGDADRQALLTVDKQFTAFVLQGMGLPTPGARAIFSPQVSYGPGLPRLTTVEALAEYLLEPAHLPFFGKPVNGSRALGAISVMALGQAPGSVVLGDGREVDAGRLSREIAAGFPRGWIIQELLENTPEMARRAGPALAALRFVTLWLEGGPAPFYVLWRIPAVGAMTDGVVSGTNILAEIDPATGVVRRAQYGDHLTGHAVTKSLVDPEADLVGFGLPDWERVVATCVEGHRGFPGHGLLGWDVAITPRGPVVTEINTNPLHTLYQRTVDEGFLSPPRKAKLAEAEAALKARLALFAGAGA